MIYLLDIFTTIDIIGIKTNFNITLIVFNLSAGIDFKINFLYDIWLVIFK